MIVRLDDAARDDVREATAWYAARDPSAARRFVSAVDVAIDRIAESPSDLPLLETWTGDVTIRRLILRPFPYVIVFEEFSDEVVVWCVTHTSRRPQHWQHRRHT
jgi:plasmid stabilization system protein ParE